jgi:hypothetical protein
MNKGEKREKERERERDKLEGNIFEKRKKEKNICSLKKHKIDENFKSVIRL